MASISSLGIGSGLDSESIVTKLVALEKQPIEKLKAQATLEQAKITAFGQVQSQFSALGDAANAISQPTAWKTTKATSSNPTAATITSTSTAAAQSFTLDVDRLAAKQSLTSAALTSSAFVGAGTLTIKLGTWANTGGASTAAATLAAANAALTAAQSTLATATATKTTKDDNLATANQALADADAALVAPTATRDAAQSAYDAADAIYQSLFADQATKQSAYDTALASYNTADTAATNATTALAAADASLATATTASVNADSALVTANASLATADANLASANTTLANATSASSTANGSRDAALSAYTSALGSLNNFVTTDPDALLDPNAAAYATAYSDWLGALSTAAGSGLQADLDAVAVYKTTLDNAKAALQSSSPAVLANADALTGSADSTEPTALILAANNATTALATATTAQATATTAQATASADQAAANTAALAASAALALATTDQGTAAAAKAAADTALTAATTARDNALTDLNAANAALVTPTQDRLDAQTALDAAEAALAPFTTARTTALSDQALAASEAAAAQTDFDNATAAVATATAQVAAATAGVPVFTGGTKAEVNVTATATDTISTLAAKINAANAGVVATVFTDGANQRLLLTSKDTGEAAGFRIQVNDTGDGGNTDATGLSRFGFDPQNASFGYGMSGVAAQYAQDAQVRINGVSTTSKNNTFADNIPGVTITVQATTTTGFGTPGEIRNTANLNVSEDVTPAVKSVNDFITAYNSLITNLTELTKYDAATKTPSAFQGDSAVVGLLNILRNMTGSISNGSVYKRLSDIGVQVQRNGTLSMDTTKLSVAANNGDELKNLFLTDNKNAQTNGFALKFAALAKGVLGSNGAVTNKANALQKGLQVNSTEQQRILDRAASFEARLRKQYSALDAKMAGLNALNAYVAQQVTTWNKSTN